MADESTNYEINVVGNDKGIKETANSLGEMQDQAREGAKVFNSLAKAAERAEKFTSGFTKAQQEQNKALKDGLYGLSEYQRAAAKLASLNSSVTLDKGGNPRRDGKQLSNKAVQEELAIHEKITEELDRQEREIRQQIVARKELIAETKRLREFQQNAYVQPTRPGGKETPIGPGSAEGVANRFMRSGLVDANAAKEAAQSLEQVRQANIAGAEAALQHANRLTNMRYSLYEVSNTAMLTVAALAAVNIGTLAAAATYETAMAQISRTSGATGEQLRGIREDFVDLAQTIPATFSDLSEIGTLAGQLNIAAPNIAKFTETTAKFTATTNVTAEAAGTAFGRLDALLDDVNGNYEALGSSILEVGVNSVATETEIIATTNQITAAAQQAGFAADEIIGLAASFASLGVAPEASRGTVIRVFSTINTAVSETNENLTSLAQYAGQSASDFANAWKSDPAEAFQAVLRGMQGAAEQGENLEGVIRGMGITAVRDINALLKLAQNADIVGNNFQYAAQGFSEATALTEAFDTQAATLASKLQVLANSLQALFATLGESGLGPVGAFVDLLNGVLNVVTDLAASPFVQWSAAVVGGLTALGAVAALIVAGISRMSASVIAGAQAMAAFRVEVARTTGQALTFKSAMDFVSTSMTGSATAARVLRGALLGLGVMGVIAVVGGVVAETIDNIANSMKSAEQRAVDYFGELGDLSKALQSDTQAAKEGGVVYGEVEGRITSVTRSSADWAQSLQNVTGQQINATGAVQETTTSVDDQTFVIGKNTAAWIANKLATDESLIAFLQYTDEIQNSRGISFDQEGFLTAITRNDVDTAKGILAEYKQAIIDSYGGTDSLSVIQNDEAYNKAVEMFNKMSESTTLYEAAIGKAAVQQDVYNRVLEATGTTQQDAANAAYYGADALDEYSYSADAAAERSKALQAAVTAAFSEQNIMGQWVQDSYALATGIAEGGNAFNYLSMAGIENLNNLQTSIVSTIEAGATMGASATESVAALFLSLQKMGVDTANLMGAVASIAGTSISAVQQAMDAPSASTNFMSKYLDQVTANARRAAASIGSGGGGGGGGGRKSVAGAAKEAQKEVRTLVDYANDLAKVFDRSWEIRFGFQDAKDDANSIFNQMVEDADDAKKGVRDLKTEINGLNADLRSLKAERNSLNYFLSVANQYGDNLRATEIGAEIGKVNAEIAETTDDVNDKKSDLAKAEAALTKTTKGNSQAAIDNRAKLSELAKAHRDSVAAFAKTGASQKEIEAYAKKAEQAFVQQALSLGYSRKEISAYEDSFKDLGTIIKGVPRNITVNASTNPAVQALRELESQAKKSGTNARNNFANAFKGTGRLPGPTFGKPDNGYLAKALRDQIKVLRAQMLAEYDRTGGNSNGRTNSLQSQINRLNKGLKDIGYKDGGYTGRGGTSDVAGVVHGKEFVVNAENTAKFRPILEAMNRGQMPAMAMPVPTKGGYTELSPYDRALLRNLGNTQLRVDGKVLGEATSAANFKANRRGVA